MKVYGRRFNLYFALLLAVISVCGCKTGGRDDQHDKAVAALRVHIQINADNAGDLSTVQTVSVPRTDPVVVTVAKEPVLTEANIIAARIIPSPGGLGYAVAVQFDETGALMLEQYTAANVGNHFVIFGQWGDKLKDGRWLAAPIIRHQIANGVLSFNGDFSSTNELNQLVLGLNNVARKIKKGLLK
jgi:preprotein translocase subunit SecD